MVVDGASGLLVGDGVCDCLDDVGGKMVDEIALLRGLLEDGATGC